MVTKLFFFASIFIYFSFKKRILKDINLRYCIIRFYKRRSFYPICIANLLYTVNIKQFKKWWWCKYGIIFFQNEIFYLYIFSVNKSQNINYASFTFFFFNPVAIATSKILNERLIHGRNMFISHGYSNTPRINFLFYFFV